MPSECPVCGAAVPPKARACPGCGADERSGWNEDDARYDGLDLPDSAFEDEDADYPAAPRPRRAPLRPGVRPFWWLVALGLLLLFLASLLAPLLP
jgi:hypothetical protein